MTNNKTTFCAAILLAALATAPTGARAQISFEARGSLQRPVGDFKNNANGNAGFAGDVFFNVSPQLSLYGGYGVEMFGCDGCSGQDDRTSKGPELGVKLLAASRGGILPWVRVGATLHQLEVNDGALHATSDRRVGIQVSAGLDLPLGQMLSFSPAIRYQAYRAEFPIAGGALVALRDVRFLSLDFGLHIHPAG